MLREGKIMLELVLYQDVMLMKCPEKKLTF